MSDNVTDVTKSQEYLDPLRTEDAAKAAAADEIIAAVEVEKKAALTKAQGFTFAAEADHASGRFHHRKANAPVVALLKSPPVLANWKQKLKP